MVGWMGGCCCGPTEPPGGICANGLLETFTDDFSPTFDPGWDAVVDLVADAGICRATGQWVPWFAGYTHGFASGRFQKVTLSGKTEATVKLVDWQELPLLPGNTYQASITLGGAGVLFPTSPLFRAAVFAYRTSTLNQYVYNSPLGVLHYTGVVPQDGDTFGLRLSDHVSNSVNDFSVLARKVEVLVNGAVVWSQTGAGLVEYLKCDFYWTLAIWQVAFPAGFPFPGQSIIKLDDFAAVCE